LVSRGGTKRDEMGSVLSCCLQGRLVAVLQCFRLRAQAHVGWDVN
jgi:hypothetical protein